MPHKHSGLGMDGLHIDGSANPERAYLKSLQSSLPKLTNTTSFSLILLIEQNPFRRVYLNSSVTCKTSFSFLHCLTVFYLFSSCEVLLPSGSEAADDAGLQQFCKHPPLLQYLRVHFFSDSTAIKPVRCVMLDTSV